MISMDQKMKAAVQAAKDIKKDCDIKGTNWTHVPGDAALAIDPEIIRHLGTDLHSVMITGTNGKTTTANMISAMLDAEGIDHACNRTGTNLSNGIATVMCLNCDENYNAKAAHAVLECDERYTLQCMPRVNPEVLVITNIFRDQYSRFHGEENAAADIISAMKNTAPAVCCIDSRCSFIDRFTEISGWRYVFFDVEDENVIVDGEKYPMQLSMPGKYNMRNAAAAIAAVKAMGMLSETGLLALRELQPVFGRGEHICGQGLDIRMMLAKNSAGWKAVTDSLSEICMDKISELYLVINDFDGDDKDHSWLFTNDYQQLFRYFEKIYLAGSCANIILNEISEKAGRQIGRVSTLKTESVIPAISEKKTPCFIICNYSAMIRLREELAAAGAVKQFWDIT